MKAGIRVHGIEAADNIWFTCCALNNMLFNVDGLDKRWKKGVQSPFEGELGWHAVGDVETYAPLMFRRVNNVGNIRELDTSARGNFASYNNIDIDPEDKNDEAAIETNYKILRMTNKKFRDKLVINFHKRWCLLTICFISFTCLLFFIIVTNVMIKVPSHPF